jgi:hypothetical protein
MESYIACTVAIRYCIFSDNDDVTISSTSISGCSVTISHSNFTNNSYALFFAHSDVRLIDSNFLYNRLPNAMRSTNFEAIIAAAYSTISMSQCSFQANEAIRAGGIIFVSNSYIYGEDLVLCDNKAFEGTLVMNQCAANFSGSITFDSNNGSLVSLRSMVKFYGRVSFFNNSPSTRDFDDVRGGAITLYFGELCLYGPTQLSNNHANMGGAILTVESEIYMYTNVKISSNIADSVGGGIFAYRTPINVLSNVKIFNNEAEFGGGIYAISTSITVTSSEDNDSLSHDLIITNNTADQYGGGLYFSSNSRLYVYQLDPRYHNMSAILTFNTAQRGGAFYISDETYVDLCRQANQTSDQLLVDSQCIFQVVDLYRNTGSLRLIFDSNKASESGSIMYGGLLDRCIVSPLTYVSFFNSDIGPSLKTWNGMTYLRNVSNIESFDSIASRPVRICFCFENKPNCSVEVQRVYHQKGREFKVALTVLDQADHPLPNVTVFTELLQSTTGGLGDGLQSQMVNSEKCEDLTFSVTSTSNKESLTLYPKGPCGSAMLSSRTINIIFSECTCPIGFSPDQSQLSSCVCVCNKVLHDHGLIEDCTNSSDSFLKASNSWIDYVNTSEHIESCSNSWMDRVNSPDSGSVIFRIARICPYDYCKSSSLQVNLNLLNGANQQCANNRVGKLCGGCQSNYSLSAGRSGCVECDDLWPLNAFLFSLTNVLTGLFLVALILFLNLTVTVGTINGFFFSANILRPIFPSPRQGYPTNLYSVLNFDIDVGTDVCYYKGYDTYAKIWIQLEYPVYLFFIVFVIILISRWSPRFAKFIGKRNPIETLATLIFASYAKLLQFIISALSYGDIEYYSDIEPSRICRETVWLPDANIGYLEPKHAIMFIGAILVLIAVLLYTLILFFWQWLQKLPNWKVLAILRNNKLNSFIETYHIPYNSTHRYWTGLLLLIRMMTYIIAVFTSAFNDTSTTSLAVIVMLSSLFFIKTLSVRVYRKWPLDALESALIINTIFMAAVALYAGPGDATSTAATITSSIIVGILIICVFLYHIKKTFIKRDFDIKKLYSKLKKKEPAADPVAGYYCDMESVTNLSALGRRRHPLAMDRHESILAVMDPPTDSDYL